MAIVVEETSGKTRDLPIAPELRNLLKVAAEEAGISKVRVTSGGQCPKGTCTKRTGSTRHDAGQAADLQLLIDDRLLRFTVPADLPQIVSFVSAAASAGATGFGAGLNYMGNDTIHVGFGSRAVWGAGGQSSNAPQWLINAARAGWETKGIAFPKSLDFSLDSDDEELENDYK